MIYCTYITFYRGSKLPPFYIGHSTIKKVEKGYRGFTEEHNRKISDFRKQYKYSDEACAKISASKKGKPSPNKGKRYKLKAKF